MSLKEYNFSVKTTGTDYYTVQAESEEQAIQLIKKGVDKQFLIDHNVKAENIGSTQAVRRKQIVEILLELNKLKEKGSE